MTRFRALKNRNYRLYFYGQLISMIGTWMQGTVQAWLVYRLTGSAFWIGAISFFNQASAFFTSPVAGVVADQHDRRQLLVWIEWVAMIQALAMAILVFSGRIHLWEICLLSVVLGIVTSFEITTRHAFAADLVGKADVGSAISLNSITINGTRVVGPALGGMLIGLFGSHGEGWAFLLNALSFLAVIVSLKRMKFREAGPPRRVSFAENSIHSIWMKFSSAWNYVKGQRSILVLMAFAGFLSFVGFPYMVLLPVFAKDILHGDADTLGLLTGMSGVGAILGSLIVGARSRGTQNIQRELAVQVLGLSISLVTLGLSTQLWLSIAACIGIGFSLMGAFPRINTAIQEMVDDSMRARVLSIYTMTFLGAVPIGSVIAGWLADRFGAPVVEIGAGGLCLLFLLAFAWISGTSGKPQDAA